MATNDAVPTKSALAAPAKLTPEQILAQRPFDGTMKRLEVHGEIPGYQLQWSNDEGSRIPTLLRYGFEFVLKSEIDLNDRVIDGNQAVDDKVKRRVGTGDRGDATYAYLLKCPETLWDAYQAEMQKRPDQFDRFLTQGLADSTKGQYNPSHQTANKIDAGELQPAQFNHPTGQRPQPHRMGGPTVKQR